VRRLSALLALAALAAGCGRDGGSSGTAASGDAPVVLAASSLTDVFESIGPDAKFTFAGSDELASEIQEGAPADVYAAASPKYPTQLNEEGLVDEPQIFATNRLVIVVPSGNPAGIKSVVDMAKPGVKVVVGAEGVPIGDYTRTVLESMGQTAVLDNVVSNEDDVKGVLAKVASGDADAGLVYVTDTQAAGDEVEAIELPASAQAKVEYPIAIVTDAAHMEAAQQFVDLVMSDEGQQELREAGFGPP
jgi:molybdate transport system substrate-binding protein